MTKPLQIRSTIELQILQTVSGESVGAAKPDRKPASATGWPSQSLVQNGGSYLPQAAQPVALHSRHVSRPTVQIPRCAVRFPNKSLSYGSCHLWLSADPLVQHRGNPSAHSTGPAGESLANEKLFYQFPSPRIWNNLGGRCGSYDLNFPVQDKHLGREELTVGAIIEWL